jgi:hypothetical protein
MLHIVPLIDLAMMKRGQRSCDTLGVGRSTGYAIANRMRGKSDSLTFDESARGRVRLLPGLTGFYPLKNRDHVAGKLGSVKHFV